MKKDKTQDRKENTKIIEGICVQNKMEQKITFSIIGKDTKGNEIQKELVIQKDGKECIFELPKGIYTYKIVLSNNEIFKKGEYKFEEELTIIVRQENE